MNISTEELQRAGRSIRAASKRIIEQQRVIDEQAERIAELEEAWFLVRDKITYCLPTMGQTDAALKLPSAPDGGEG